MSQTCERCGKERTTNGDGLCQACADEEPDRFTCDVCGQPERECLCHGAPMIPGGPTQASREEQRARYLDCGPLAWDDRDE